MLSSTHRAMLASKDAHLLALREEIKWLREFARPSMTVQSVATLYEADAIIEGKDEPIDVPFTSDEILRERDRLLSGAY